MKVVVVLDGEFTSIVARHRSTGVLPSALETVRFEASDPDTPAKMMKILTAAMLSIVDEVKFRRDDLDAVNHEHLEGSAAITHALSDALYP